MFSVLNGLSRGFSLFHEFLSILCRDPNNVLFLRLHLLFVLGDGKCVICDSFVNPKTLVHICDECNYGSNENRCVVCGNVGVTDAYYCRECVQQGKHCEGCPKIVNLGAVRGCNELFVLREAVLAFPKRSIFIFFFVSLKCAFLTSFFC